MYLTAILGTLLIVLEFIVVFNPFRANFFDPCTTGGKSGIKWGSVESPQEVYLVRLTTTFFLKFKIDLYFYTFI